MTGVGKKKNTDEAERLNGLIQKDGKERKGKEQAGGKIKEGKVVQTEKLYSLIIPERK